MSVNWLLIWTVTISCALILFSLIRHRVRSPLRYLPVVVVGGVLLFCYQTSREAAGYYAGLAWFVLLFFPGLTSQFANHFLGMRRFRLAYLTSWAAYFVQPFPETRDQPRLVQALWALHRGDEQAAARQLQALSRRKSSVGMTAFVILTRMQGAWQDYLDTCRSSSRVTQRLADPLLSNIYLQALGETGDLSGMLRHFEQVIEHPQRGTSIIMLNIARMKVAAFCGDLELVATLLDGPLSHFDLATREFWLATALQTHGRREESLAMFAELKNADDRQIAIASERRMLHPLASVNAPDSECCRVLSEIRKALQHESHFALMMAPAAAIPIATWGLVGVLLLMFGAEMLHGEVGRIVWESTSLSSWEKLQLMLSNTIDNQNLYQMGALVLPASFSPDSNWRVLRAAFLHFGLLHLSMNVAGLLIFGQRLEEAWGALLTCISYLTCAILSIYLMTLLPMGTSANEPYVLVGASGGVMGLVGCLLGYLGRGRLVRRNHVVAKEFNLLFLIVVAQMVFDQLTPNVSSECHLLGLLIGICLGFGVGLVKKQTSSLRL